MSDTRIIKKRYIFMAVVFVGLALLLVLLPEKHISKEIKPEKLLQEINDNTRYYTTDDVAEKIIAGDLFMHLIDVRSAEEFKKFHLKSAINIPLDSLLNKNKKGGFVNDDILNQDVYTNVLYSNGTIYSSQAWLLLRRLNFKNNYVMKGGLNNWIETIIKPKRPANSAPKEDFDKYSFRKAASMFFGGGSANVRSSNEDNAPTVIIKKSAVKEEEGGC